MIVAVSLLKLTSNLVVDIHPALKLNVQYLRKWRMQATHIFLSTYLQHIQWQYAVYRLNLAWRPLSYKLNKALAKYCEKCIHKKIHPQKPVEAK